MAALSETDTAVPTPETAARGRLWLLLGLALALLASLPAILARYPQMTDYPAHLARYHVMLEIAHNPVLQRFYSFDWWWSGNLGADLLIQPLAAVFGLELGGRILVILIPALNGFAILAVEWALRRRIGFGSFLAMLFIWSPALLLGFLNFTLSLAAMLFAFAAWVLLEGKRWRALVMAPFAVVVWLCHVSGWGILGLAVFGYEWQRRGNWTALLAPLPLCLPFIPLLAGGGTKGLFSYGPNVQAYKLAIWMQAMRDQWRPVDQYSLAYVLGIILLAVVIRKIDWRLGSGALAVLIGSIVIPRHIFGGDLADSRMISTGLMLMCLAIEWRPPLVLMLSAPALFLARLEITTSAWQVNSRETEVLLGALDHLPRGARVASAVQTEIIAWFYSPLEHICGYAVVRRDALSNCNFALPKVHMLKVNHLGREFADPSHRIRRRPHKPVELADFAPARHTDYLWYVGPIAPSSLPQGAQIIWRSPHSFLARLAKPDAQR